MERNISWSLTATGKKSDYYIDFDGYSSDLVSEGFGTFVVVRDKAWF